ncbi:MAG: TRAP transporter substrate-binding protein [Proteobacteria bacterium]|nr:TRAP transporter substrate-binding protein [Pseudomonadota bacterium]
MKRLTLSLLAALFAAGLTAVSTPAAAQQRLRIAGNFALDHSSTLAIEQFKKDVEAATKGALIIETFPNMQLGGAQENVSQTRAGTIAMTWVGMAFLSRTVPELEAVSLPFMFPNREVAYKVMDGPMGDLINQKLADKGFVALGFMELGPRQVTNNVRPIKTVADLKGLKIRLQPNETHIATFKALGANALSMDIKEVYSAMQQNVIDGHENPYNLILASRFFEVQKYLSNTAHFFDFIAVVANKKVIDSLSPELRAAIKTAMTKAVAGQRAVAAKNDADALAELQKKGMQYDALPPAELAKMRQMTSGVIDDVKKRIGPELVDRALAEVKKAGG